MTDSAQQKKNANPADHKDEPGEDDFHEHWEDHPISEAVMTGSTTDEDSEAARSNT